jgi:peptidoglycan hydrolase-like protein with peptidoglycan-binding domain
MSAPVVWRERHRAGDDYVRDFHGRFADTPGGGPDLPAAADKLNLAGRIELGPGETLAGSAALKREGIAAAAVDSPAGRRIRLGVGIHPEDIGSWSGANKGSTVVLDEHGVAELRAAIPRMREAAEAGKRRNAGFAARDRELLGQQKAVLARQYPALRKAQVQELAEIDRKIADIDADNEWRRSIAHRSASSPQPEIDKALGERRVLEHRRAVLTAKKAPLSAADEAELEQIQAEVKRNADEYAQFNLGLEALAEGSVPGGWGSVRWQVAMEDGTPAYRLAVAANDKPWDFGAEFDASELRKVTGLLDTLGAERSARESFNPGQRRDSDGQWSDGIPGPGGLARTLRIRGENGVDVQFDAAVDGSLKVHFPFADPDDSNPVAHLDTIRLGPGSAGELGEELDALATLRKDYVRRAKAAWNAVDDHEPGTPGYDAAVDAWYELGGDGQLIAGGELDGDVGALVYQMRMGIEVDDTHLLIGIRPAGADPDAWDLHAVATDGAGEYLSMAAVNRLRKHLAAGSAREARDPAVYLRGNDVTWLDSAAELVREAAPEHADEVIELLTGAVGDIDADEERVAEAVEAAIEALYGDAEPEQVVEGGWDPTTHPRAAAGSAAGGEFAAGGGTATQKAGNAPAKQKAGNAPKRKGAQALSYDAKSGRGAGYGKPGGDARVKKLQTALNRLGLKDTDGRALKVDGKLGPRTTAAIKAAQRKLGVPADGKVTPQLLAKMVAAKSLTKTAKKPVAKKAPAKKAAPKTTTTTTSSGGRRVTVTRRSQEGGMTETVDAVETPDRIEGRVLESAGETEDGSRVFRVRIIAAGDSKNGRRYPATVLRESAGLYEGARAYDHHRSAEELRSSTINGLVGYYRNVEASDEGLDADLCLLPSATHTAEALDATVSAQAAGLPALVGISHDAMTYTRPIQVGRRRMQEAVSIAKVNSADVVADPAAGGKATRVLAGGIEETDPEDSGESNEEEDVPLTSQTVLAALKDASPEDLAAVGLSKVDTTDGPATAEPVQATEAAPAAVEKASFLGGLMIREKVAAAGLGERVVESVREVLPDRVTESDVDAQIAALKSAMGLIERGDLHPTATAVVTQESLDKKKAALDAFFSGDYSGYRSFRDAYLDVTGYRPRSLGEDLNKRIMRESIGDLYDSADRTTESLTSSSWNLVLGDSITRRLVAAYAHPSLQTWRSIVSSTIPVNDFRTQRIDRVGGYGVLPAVNQGAPYQPLTSPANEEVTYAITKRGGTEDLTLEMIANDDVRAISNIPKKLGLAAARTLHNFVWDFILTNPTIYDTNTLFHASHSNTTAVALSQSNVSTLRAKMRDGTAYGDTSDILSLVPKILVVPNELEELAFQIATSAVAIPATPAGPSNTPNLHAGLQPIVLDYDTDANDWFLVADPDMCPTIEVGFYQGRQEPELFTQSDQTVGSMFNADKVLYKIRHIYSGAVLDYRGFQRGTQ